MRKNRLNYILLLFAFAFFFSSCSKDSLVKNHETFIVSPGNLIDMTGKDWDEVEAQLKDKIIYGYTEVPHDQVSVIKAVISLPVIDTSNGSINCSLVLNVDSSTNKVGTVLLHTVDLLPGFNMDEAYALM